MSRSHYIGLGAVKAPEYLQRAIELRGGLNPYGEPMYRLVRTEGRFRESWGTWREFVRGTAMRDRNVASRAWRVFVGMKLMPVYPGEHGWALERWAAPEFYGSPVMWYAPMSMGGTMRWIPGENRYVPSLGDYPYRGDYEGTSYIFRTCMADTATMDLSELGGEEARGYIFGPLSETLLMTAIGRMENFREGLPVNRLTHANQAIAAEEQREERAGERYEALAKDILDDVGSISARTPGGWAEIHREAEAIGIRSHLGG